MEQMRVYLHAGRRQPGQPLYCMFISESSSVMLQQIKIIKVLKEGNLRDSVYGPYWTMFGKGSG
jgi:hypothetical protein